MAVTRELMLEQLERATSWKNPTAWDVLWGLLVVAGSGYAYTLYQPFMDGYEVAIQLLSLIHI